jgi:ClpP class serine protease
MKTSRLLTSVLREPWMMMPEAAEMLLPIVANWLRGIETTFDEKGVLEYGIVGGMGLGDHIGSPQRSPLRMVSAGKIGPGDQESIADFPDGSVAIINLKGELTKYDGLCNYGAVSISNLTKAVGASKNISGVVMDVDGPGGAVNAISTMIEAIQFVQSMGKPVVVHGDLVASAHLYVAVYADHFMVDNTIGSRVGSIGTLIQFADYTEYFKKEGISLRTIYAPESTHKNLEFEKAKEGDDEPMKNNVLSPLAKGFQNAVIQQRQGKLNDKVEGILNGSMFWGEDAVKYGLADSIGTLGDAIQRVLDLVEIRKFMSFSR